ncbi:hypothetical protein [Tahibacter harae]|uniref:Carboxypeptidase regulatory-like domain-containing protein n=1 Tax=Tahibacter harae TaxID=2963937 RepID=A0ABT1QQL5_9GAMM|nr:hypothetical protein [Tahibacter harae]MCQ4164593.1 hypothetical protein [Tahibacter harae]
MKRAIAPLLLSWLASTAAAQTPADRIYQSGFEAAFTIAGHIGYPTPLAGATVEAHAGNQVAATLSAADGTYRLAIEYRHLTPDTLIDLVGFGRGARSSEVWAGALGPYSRLQVLAGGNTLSDSQEAFARLGPYSTAVSAALRGFNGFQRITDPLLFERAARASAPDRYLVYGLALIANGTITLPAGAANTFAAVLSPAPARAMYTDVAGQDTAPCTQASDSPVCALRATLALDAAVMPTAALTPGVSYMPFLPYGGSLNTTAEAAVAYRISNGSSGLIFYKSAQGLAANVSSDAQGRLTLARSDGLPLDSTTSTVLIGNVQVQQTREVLSLVVRPSPGPGGVMRHAYAFNVRLLYPNNPEIPTQQQPAMMNPPLEVAADDLVLPPLLQASAPNLVNGDYLLPLAIDLGVPADPFGTRFGYDRHQFTGSNGAALRRGQSFTWNSPGAGRFSLLYGNTQASLRLLNEEEPGVWRVLLRSQNAGQEIWLTGVLMAHDGAGWSAGSPPASYLADINGQVCSTPYGALNGDVSFGVCEPLFGWVFNPNNTLDRLDTPGWGNWAYATGADTGRLLMNRGNGTQRRGWEQVRLASGRGFVLENVTNGNPAPAISFAPTGRLVRITVN